MNEWQLIVDPVFGSKIAFRELPDGSQESMSYEAYLAAGNEPLE